MILTVPFGYGFSRRMGFEKKFSPNFFRPPDSSGEMPAEEAKPT